MPKQSLDSYFACRMSEKNMPYSEEDIWKHISDLLEEIHQMKSFLHQDAWSTIVYKLEQIEKELDILMTLFQQKSDKKYF